MHPLNQDERISFGAINCRSLGDTDHDPTTQLMTFQV